MEINFTIFAGQVRTLIGDIFNIERLKEAGEWLARNAEVTLPGATGPEKKAWAKKVLLEAIEKYDDRLPVIGLWMDLPIVDALERSGVDWAVERGYALLPKKEAASEPTVPPETP